MSTTRPPQIPAEIDVLIVGGGTSGAALAGLLARDTDLAVVLLEAGPDYGPLAGGRWPADLLDARECAGSHGWGYSGLAHATHTRPTAFSRARVIGGCSSHNGCVALLGHRLDYDNWAAAGNEGWGWASVAPAFDRAKAGLRVRFVDDVELTPFQAAFLAGAAAAGVPRVHDLNDPDDRSGVAASPVNIYEGRRWNTALGYLDPVRDRPNLTIIGDVLVDRVEVRGGRAVAVEALIAGARMRLSARRIVLAAGAYGSPAILLRSGIGEPDELRPLGITPVHALPGVGRNLVDHPAVTLRYRGSDQLHRAMDTFGAAHWLPDEQTLLKAGSGLCREAFDLHLYAVSGHDPVTGDRTYTVTVSSVDPRSTGALTLASADPTVAPLIDHGYLTDPDDHDLNVLLDGITLARDLAASAPTAPLFDTEIGPAAGRSTRADLADFVRNTVGIYYHPACTCRMGPDSDPLAVVNPDGQVHGLDNLFVCDASIFPTIMRANTNLPATMLAEHLATRLGTL